MRFSKTADWCVHVLLPVLTGSLLYFDTFLPGHALVRNHLADGLWSFAFTSAILLIWNRSINLTWLLIAFFTGVLYELLQHLNFFTGTADAADVVTYAVFMSIAIASNFYCKRFYISPNNSTTVYD